MEYRGRIYTPALRAWIGLFTGLFVAGLFSAYAVAVWLWNGQSLAEINTRLSQLVATYFIWGVLAGSCTGFAFPVTGTKRGSFLVGGCVLASAYLTLELLHGRVGPLTWALVGLGLIAGGVGGIIMFGSFWRGETRRSGPRD